MAPVVITIFFRTEQSRLRNDHAIIFLHSGHRQLDPDHHRRRHRLHPLALLSRLLHLALLFPLLQVNDVTHFITSHIL